MAVQHLQQLLQLQLAINGNLQLEELHGAISEALLHKRIHPQTILQLKLDLKELHLHSLILMGMGFMMNQFHVQEQIQI